MPRLSELPGFLPLGEPGSPELRACALGTFTNREANLDFVRYLIRECNAATHAHASTHTQHPTQAAGVLEGTAHG